MQINEESKELLKFYSEQGFYVFPCFSVQGNICTCSDKENCTKAGKHPRGPWTDPNFCTNDYDQMLAMFGGEFHNCNIAVNCELSNIWVIDVDVKKEAAGVDNYQKLITDLGIHNETLIHRTPSGGFHVIFKQPELKCVKRIGTTKDAYPGIDVRGDGGYIVLPPSVAPANDWGDSSVLRKSAEYTMQPENNFIVEAFPEWFGAFHNLQQRSNENYIDRRRFGNEVNFEDSQINPHVRNWGEIERALSHIPSDCINIPEQNRSSGAVYFKVLGAIADACPGRLGLELAKRWSAAVSLDGQAASNYYDPSRVEYEFFRARNGNEQNSVTGSSEVSSFRTLFHMSKALGCGPNMNWWGGQVNQFRRVSVSCQPPADSKSPDVMIAKFRTEIAESGDYDMTISDEMKIGQEAPPIMPDLELKGAVKYAFDYINSINPVDMPLLSILPALNIVSAATNRSFNYGNLRSFLYCLNSCEAGGGKAAGVNGSKILMESINRKDFIMGDPRSAAAMYRHLSTNPNSYWINDEFADKLQIMFDKNNNSNHMKEINKLILESYSAGGGTLPSMLYADEENDSAGVVNPHINIFGVFADNVIGDILSKDQINSGFVRRFLLNWSPPKKTMVKGDDLKEPDVIALHRFNEWYHMICRKKSHGSLDAALNSGGSKTPTELFMGVDSEPYNRYFELAMEIEEKKNSMGDSDQFKMIYNGWQENVKKLAMVLRASTWHLDPEPQFSVYDIETAAKIVTNSCDTWVHFFRHYIYDGEIDKVRKKLIEALNIEKTKGVMIPKFMRKHGVRKALMYEIANNLVDCGDAYSEKVLGKTADNRRIETNVIWNINYIPKKIRDRINLENKEAEKNSEKPVNANPSRHNVVAMRSSK